MIKLIHYLQENTQILELLKERKVSLVGVNEIEIKAIIDAFNERDSQQRSIWG